MVLPEPVWPDDGHRLAGLHLERDTLQDRLSGIVRKAHIPELDLAAHRPRYNPAILIQVRSRG